MVNCQLGSPSESECRSPRVATGQPRACEAALMDRHNLSAPKQPPEILRTAHGFDACIACAVQVLDPHGEELTRVRVS